MPSTTLRETCAALVAAIDAVPNIDGFLTQGPRPPRGRVAVVHVLQQRPVGPLGNPDRDLRLSVQTSCFGLTPEQALWTHDEVSDALLRSTLTIDGANTTLEIFRDGYDSTLVADEDLAEPIYFMAARWIVQTRPL